MFSLFLNIYIAYLADIIVTLFIIIIGILILLFCINDNLFIIGTIVTHTTRIHFFFRFLFLLFQKQKRLNKKEKVTASRTWYVLIVTLTSSSSLSWSLASTMIAFYRHETETTIKHLFVIITVQKNTYGILPLVHHCQHHHYQHYYCLNSIVYSIQWQKDGKMVVGVSVGYICECVWVCMSVCVCVCVCVYLLLNFFFFACFLFFSININC